jgi:hypothetical protein
VKFEHLSENLNIGGSSYTLVSNILGLQGAITGSTVYVALADNDHEGGTNFSVTPIPLATPVEGIVEGLGNTISNFTINSTAASAALFAQVNSTGTVKDLLLSFGVSSGTSVLADATDTLGEVAGLVVLNDGQLIGDSVAASGMIQMNCPASCNCGVSDLPCYVGGLAAQNEGIIENCSASAPIVSAVHNSYDGGLIGYDDYNASVSGAGAVTNSNASGTVTGSANSADGGLVGDDYEAVISSSYATGSVTDTTGTVGGLVGVTGQFGAGRLAEILDSYYETGTVSSTGTAAATVGGLVGINGGMIGGTISMVNYWAWSSGNVTGPVGGDSVGGLVGQNLGSPGVPLAGSITFAYALGSVTGGGALGGLVGGNTGAIDQSFATGSVMNIAIGSVGIGGLVGTNGSAQSSPGSIVDSYSMGAVHAGSGSNGTDDAGGLVGQNGASTGIAATVATSYSTGAVTGNSGCLGGFVGSDGYAGDITSSYWDTISSGITAGAGCPAASPGSEITGETTTTFQSGTLPKYFSATVWTAPTGEYPYLTANPPP